MSVEGPERFTGGCRCGSVRIVASGRPYRVGVCRGALELRRVPRREGLRGVFDTERTDDLAVHNVLFYSCGQ